MVSTKFILQHIARDTNTTKVKFLTDYWLRKLCIRDTARAGPKLHVYRILYLYQEEMQGTHGEPIANSKSLQVQWNARDRSVSNRFVLVQKVSIEHDVSIYT